MIVTESRRRVLGRLVGFAALGAVAPIVIGCAGPGGGSANDAPGRLEIPDQPVSQATKDLWRAAQDGDVAGLARTGALLDQVRPDIVHIGHLNHLSTSLILEAARRDPGKPPAEASVSLHGVFRHLDTVLQEKTLVIADVGESLFASVDLHVHRRFEFLSPAYYTSMGFAVPAAVGASFAEALATALGGSVASAAPKATPASRPRGLRVVR